MSHATSNGLKYDPRGMGRYMEPLVEKGVITERKPRRSPPTLAEVRIKMGMLDMAGRPIFHGKRL